MRPTPLFILVILVAGCTAPKDAPATHGGSEAIQFVDHVLPDGNGGEPNLAISPDGKWIFVVAPAYTENVSANKLWRGDIATGEWSYLGTVAEEYQTNDADIAVGPDGAVWVATMWLQAAGAPTYPGAKCTAVSLSRDNGATWATNGLGCGASPFYDERPWLAANDDGAFLLRYQYPGVPFVGAVGQWNPDISRSADNGRWDNNPLLDVPQGFLSPLVARPGLVAFANFAYEDGRPMGPTYYESTDGRTFVATAVANEPNDLRHPGIGIGEDRSILTWVTLEDETRTIIRASLREGAGPWGAPITLDDTGTSGMAWSHGTGEHLVVTWLHTTQRTHPCEVSEDAEWRLRVWKDGHIVEIPRVIHRGPLFTVIQSGDCFERGRALGDYIASAVLPDGRVAIATPITTEGGEAFNAPIHLIMV